MIRCRSRKLTQGCSGELSQWVCSGGGVTLSKEAAKGVGGPAKALPHVDTEASLA